MSVNKAIIIGRLGKDPELRYTTGGTPVASFSLATDEQWTDKSGEKQKKTEWHNIVAWSKLAEICGQYLVKGKQVYIEGRIQTREWTDKDGNKRRTTEIVADQMVMLGSRSDSGGGAERSDSNEERPARQQPAAKTEDLGITDDDIPF